MTLQKDTAKPMNSMPDLARHEVPITFHIPGMNLVEQQGAYIALKNLAGIYRDIGYHARANEIDEYIHWIKTGVAPSWAQPMEGRHPRCVTSDAEG